jgi:hypothetical protein
MEITERELNGQELGELYKLWGQFHNGLAWAVDKDSKWFHIHADGTPAYEQRYDVTGDFHEERAVAAIGEKWFHICLDGQPSYSKTYDHVSQFSNGVAMARLGKSWFKIDKNGIVIENEE